MLEIGPIESVLAAIIGMLGGIALGSRAQSRPRIKMLVLAVVGFFVGPPVLLITLAAGLKLWLSVAGNH